MIVSHEFRYVFVQVPQTGSTALGDYLVEHAGGVEIPRKHNTLAEGRRVLGSSIDGYQIVASVRDPLDQIISSFHKLRTDHHNLVASGRLHDASRSVQRRAAWMAERERTLDDYLHTHFRRVYAPVWTNCLRAADRVIRYETFADDVAGLLDDLGVTSTPEIPLTNVTARPSSSIAELVRPTTLEHVLELCGPFMAEFGYRNDGATPTVSLRRRTEYEATLRLKALRRLRSTRTLRAEVRRAETSR